MIRSKSVRVLILAVFIVISFSFASWTIVNGSAGFIQLQNHQFAYYYSYDEKIPLEPAAGKFVVQFAPALAKPQVAQVGQRENLVLDNYVELYDLYIVSGLGKRRISEIPEIHYVSEVYRANGVEFFISNRFFTQFYEDVSEEEVMRLNQEYGVSIVKKYDYLGNNYLLEVPWDSKLTALDLANLYHELPSTEYAVPQ